MWTFQGLRLKEKIFIKFMNSLFLSILTIKIVLVGGLLGGAKYREKIDKCYKVHVQIEMTKKSFKK